MSNPFTRRPFSTHVDQPEHPGWQSDTGPVDERTQTEQIERLFPGYDLFHHDRMEDFDIPGIFNVPSDYGE